MLFSSRNPRLEKVGFYSPKSTYKHFKIIERIFNLKEISILK